MCLEGGPNLVDRQPGSGLSPADNDVGDSSSVPPGPQACSSATAAPLGASTSFDAELSVSCREMVHALICLRFSAGSAFSFRAACPTAAAQLPASTRTSWCASSPSDGKFADALYAFAAMVASL